MEDLLTKYKTLEYEIYEYFGYEEDWCVFPIEDSRDHYWKIIGTETSGHVRFYENKENLQNEEAGKYYEQEIYTQRFLDKWVYRGKDFTMILVDTLTDGNKFLRIFRNEYEVS